MTRKFRSINNAKDNININYGVPFFMLVNILWIIPIVLSIGILIYVFSPQSAESSKQYEIKYNQVQDKILHMNCQELQQIRLDNIAGKDISQYENHWDTIKSMYNALACGNHWGVFEQ